MQTAKARPDLQRAADEAIRLRQARQAKFVQVPMVGGRAGVPQYRHNLAPKPAKGTKADPAIRRSELRPLPVKKKRY